jgi:branched-chain amino acid transport system ATP-binding protein
MPEKTWSVPVLIVGAGPVGLALAIELGWRGVPCTLIEQSDAYARTDRAAVPGTLEEQFKLFPILLERRRQPAQTLSGGEQQMLAIARAMMSKPRLLLLDEPSLGLAPLLVERIMVLIQSLRAAGGTVLVVEQNARAALGIADRGYVMENGRITRSGKADDLLGDQAVQDAYLGGEGGSTRAIENRIRAKRGAILRR